MHQSVDAAGEADEYAEIGDRFDLTAHLIAAVIVLRELLPRVGLALLDPETDAAALFVDVEHHDLDLLADVHHFGRVHVLIGPIHFGDMHQTFHAFLYFHEAAIIGDVGHLAE